MKKDVFIGLLLMAFSGLYWLGADQIRRSNIDTGVGAQALPKGLAYGLGILSALLVIQAGIRWYRGAGSAEAEAPDPQARYKLWRALGMLLIGAVYLTIVSYTGYIVGLFLLMTGTAIYMGKKFSASLAGIAATGALAYWLLFVEVLKVPMPAGIWPSFWHSIGM